jgi:hypothetical protein
MARASHALAAVLAAAALACAAVVTATGPADATFGPGSPSGAGDTSARPGFVRARITFTKNLAHPWDSTVSWDVRRQRGDGSWDSVAHDSWRAGSGLGGAGTENACAKGEGWLPNGRYSVLQYDDYHGNLIHGRAFRLSDKRCSNGTLREQLFLHTEAGPSNTQCADAPGDQICRWEFPRINDYTSHGCIKLSPAAILALTRDYHRFFRAGVRYPLTRVDLLVR